MQVQDLCAGYAGRQVLQNISFSLAPGESVALLGPNGSGKSTLLKALSKTISFTGSVTLDGKNLATMSFQEFASLAAFVPQEEVPAFPFSVRDVIGLARISKSNSLRESADDLEIVMASAREADCADLLDRAITELSGGERQRVLIARALAQQTPIILFDEPTSHLDVQHQVITARLVRNLADQGKANLVAVHDLNLAESMCSRAIVMNQGKVVLDGRIGDVLQSSILDNVYRTAFTRHQVDGRTVLLAH